ncbi:hypothetical protein [Phenylobacterium sp.]|uniref:hypothetical protein n=1 Tax=Phenylobacterium sp. TaxID=1871053 RepID=UPI002F40D841
MARAHLRLHEHAGALLLGLTLVVAPGCTTLQPAPSPNPSPGPQLSPLSADDVSWLFPPPKTAADLANLIAVKDLTVPDPANPTNRVPIWTDADFNNFLAVVDSAAAQVEGGSRIGLPAGARSKDAWFVAGVRIDAGAPGLDPAVMGAFGQRPQIRLILQPVLPDQAGNLQVVDTAAHLIFDFATPSPTSACPIHMTPDLAALKGIVSDVATLRTALAAGQFGNTKISTASLPLGVHPGLANAATAPMLVAEMKAMLQKRLAPQRLNSMAVMGLPPGKGAPWIFLSMSRSPPVTGQFVPVPGPALDGTQFAMMLTPLAQTPRVAPAPHSNNLASITCANGAFGPAALPVASRHGSSTAEILTPGAPDLAKTKAITDLVADPKRSHFFNTDCISCHTETRRAMEVLSLTSSPGLSADVMPNGPYDVRNFGWSIDGSLRASATRRTAAETAAVVAWLNANMLKP